MVLATHLALLAVTALPQGPDGDPPVRHADLIPAGALAVVSTSSCDDHRATLAASGLDRILLDPNGVLPRLRRGVLARALGGDAPELAELEDFGLHGMSVAFLQPDATGAPRALAVVDLEPTDATALRAALSRRIDSDAGVKSITVGGDAGFGIETAAFELVAVVLEERLLLGSSVDIVAAAVARAKTPSEDSLAASPRFDAFCAHNRSSSPWLMSTYVDVTQATHWALSMAPKLERDQIASWIDRANVGAIQHLGFSIGRENDQIVERVWIGAPSPRGPLFDALMPSEPVRTDGLASLIPADASAYGVTAIRLHDAWKAIFGLLEAESPELASQARSMLSLASGQLGGVNIERDLIATLGDRIVSMGWPASPAGGGPEMVIAIDLAHADRLAAALARMPFFESSPLAGYELFLADGSAPGAMAIGDDRLVFANSERRLRRWIGERRGASTNPKVEQALRTLPDDAVAFGVADMGRAALDAIEGLDAAATMLPAEARVIRSALAATTGTGTIHYTVRSGDAGFALSMISGGGGAVRLAGSAVETIAQQILEDPDVAAMVFHAQSVERTRDARALTVIQAIRDAERRHHAEHGTFTDLDELVDRGLLPDALTDARAAPGLHAFDDALVTVLIPGGDPARGFAAVVWPADRRPGELIACTHDRDARQNALIARVSGIDRPELSDLFIGGTFDGKWTPGWRAIDAADSSTALSPRGGDSTMFRVLTVLEQQGESGAREIVEYLGHDDPLVASRAAWSLGRLRFAPAVPALIELVESHEDAEVREHAMAALRPMRDPRTVMVSIAALSDPDPLVRSLAAVNLGALRAEDGKDALVGVLTAPNAAAGDDRDAVAALLALGDLDDAEQLLPAATAFNRSSKEAQGALVWVFQQLSSKLAPDREASVLMAVLDHESALLRRFAIQRLGELSDPRTASALEARLAGESDELRPLVEVSLAAVRGQRDGADTENGGLKELTAPWVARAEALWKDRETRTLIVASTAGTFVLLIGLMIALRRRRRRREGDNWAAMTRPSTGFGVEPGGGGRSPSYEDYQPDDTGDQFPESDEALEWDEGEGDASYGDEPEGVETEWATDEATRP